jgi:hypothetical protein
MTYTSRFELYCELITKVRYSILSDLLAILYILLNVCDFNAAKFFLLKSKGEGGNMCGPLLLFQCSLVSNVKGGGGDLT